MSEDIRSDLIHRNSVALSTSDPSLYSGKTILLLKYSFVNEF